jgi:AraC-like DNA-binding protein
MQLGFADQSHLSRQFKQAYGVAPGQYRQARAIC